MDLRGEKRVTHTHTHLFRRDEGTWTRGQSPRDINSLFLVLRREKQVIKSYK